jgi:hypothetical protein
LKSITVAKNETEESQLLVFLLVASVSFYQKQEPSLAAEREIRNIYKQTQVFQREDTVFIWIRPRKVVSRRVNGHRSVSVYPSPGAGWLGMTLQKENHLDSALEEQELFRRVSRERIRDRGK